MRIVATGLLALSFISAPLFAQPIELGYSGFYKHMKTVHKAGLQQAELGFYLSRADGGTCAIESGQVRVDAEQRGEVTLLPSGQFILPYDKQLDLDKAVVNLVLTEQQPCDISIRIQAQLDGGEVTLAQLREVREEMQTLLSKMAGWPGRYFVPDIQGVHLTPMNEGDSLAVDGMVTDAGRLSLNDEQLAGEDSLLLPAVRITPWI